MIKYSPKRTKYKKYHKGQRPNYLSSYKSIFSIKQNCFSLYSVESSQMSSKQIAAFYQSLNKYIKKSGKISLNLFAHLPKTKKPLEMRMGKGKGNVALWIALPFMLYIFTFFKKYDRKELNSVITIDASLKSKDGAYLFKYFFGFKKYEYPG
jgi:ribosomal protein L16